MVKELCWEERSNGRYCKNYKLNGQDKCKQHYVDNSSSVELFLCLVVFSYFTLLGSVLYADETTHEYLKEYFLDFEEYILSMSTYAINYIKLSLNL